MLMIYASVCLVLINCTSCGTVSPKPVQSQIIDYSGNEQNGGVLGVFKDENGSLLGFLISPEKAEQYNALISIYSSKFVPPLKENEEMQPSVDGKNYIITARGMQYFLTMARWLRNGENPSVIDRVKSKISS